MKNSLNKRMGNGANPWPRRGAIAVLVLAVLAVPLSALGGADPAEVPVEMRIAKHITVTPPHFSLFLETSGRGIVMKSVDESIRVETNDTDWMLRVDLFLPGAETQVELPSDWTCVLLDAKGELISEVMLEHGSAVLPGNGRCGEHQVFLQLKGRSSARASASPVRLNAVIKGERDEPILR